MSLLARKVADSLSSASWIRRMFEEGNRLRLRHGADAVCDFSLGNPHLEPPTALLDGLAAAAADRTPGLHRYMPNTGFPAVRPKVAASVSRQYGVEFPPECIVMAGGAASGINTVLKALLDPGDEVVLFAPLFAEYRFYVMHADGVSRVVPTTATFDLDLEALAAAINEKTRVVLVNSPNNPTGRVYSKQAMEALADLLRDRSAKFGRPIILLSDDPYRRLAYDGVEVPSPPALYKNTIVVASFSKDLGLAGERIGWIALHPEMDERDLV
ncbi:MAG: aminotransferase class I/II-fold pyridoxal phosphate-dependent enzyme, partial [Planctomycetia bacterium]